MFRKLDVYQTTWNKQIIQYSVSKDAFYASFQKLLFDSNFEKVGHIKTALIPQGLLQPKILRTNQIDLRTH